MRSFFDLVEIVISFVILSISFIILVLSANITQEKLKKIKELSQESGELIEITLKYPCYLPTQKQVSTYTGAEFKCGDGNIEKIK
jgi:hypothetical protein